MNPKEIIVCDTCGIFWSRQFSSEVALIHANRFKHQMHYAILTLEEVFG